MERRFKVYGIVAIAVLLLAITSSGVIDALIKKAMEIAALIALIGIVIGFIEGLATTWLYTQNPIVAGPNADPAILAVVNSFLRLLQPFYILAIILTGVYLLFIGGTPAGRAKAKSMFWKLIFSMVLVTLSMQLFQILLNLSEVLTSAVMNISGVDWSTMYGITLPFTILIFTLAGVAALAGLNIFVTTALIIAILYNLLIPFIIGLRYLILLILAMLFPFTIFLHFLDFQFTKAFGAKLVRLTFIWTFLPVIMMLVVVGSNIAIGSYADKCGPLVGLVAIPGVNVLASIFAAIFGNSNCLMVILMSLIGTILVFATPFMMSGVMTWIGAGLAMVGMASFTKSWGTPLTTFGGILAGMGPGALMMGGTQEMFRRMAPKPPPEEPKK